MKLTKGEIAAVAVTLVCAALAVGFSAGSKTTKSGYTVTTERQAEASAVMKPGSAEPEASPGLTQGAININTADRETLCSLPGIGDTLAQRIIDYREEHGGFAAPEDVMSVHGIGEGIFAKISDYIVTEDRP